MTKQSLGRRARESRRVGVLMGTSKLASARKKKEERILHEQLARYSIDLHFQLSSGQLFLDIHKDLKFSMP